MLRRTFQVILGVVLNYAGVAHVTFARDEFRSQVPTFLHAQADFIVLASGVIEILLGVALVSLWKYRSQIGWVTALYFIAIFPGNIAQYVNGTDAFGLESDAARGIRLLFQPLLVICALWSTEAWRTFRSGSAKKQKT